ncbi:MAG: PEP-CTERM sorting domain-containing protein [Kiritimatiellae bacterium]|nr:PEP-CTERM sorting domain-containing protein [Kiritimatiellia bacterium]
MNGKLKIGITAAILSLAPVCRGVMIPWGTESVYEGETSISLVYQASTDNFDPENAFDESAFKYWAPQLREDALPAGAQVLAYSENGGGVYTGALPSTTEGYYLVVAIRTNMNSATIDLYPYEAMWGWILANEIRSYDSDAGLDNTHGWLSLEDIQNITWIPVPEPCSVALFLFGAAGLALRRRRFTPVEKRKG